MGHDRLADLVVKGPHRPDGVDEVAGPGTLVHRLDVPAGRLRGKDVWGPSGCWSCGWRGVPTFVRGRPSDICPACRAQDPGVREDRFMARARNRVEGRSSGPRVARNQPCPCGSGLKAKKCCHA